MFQKARRTPNDLPDLTFGACHQAGGGTSAARMTRPLECLDRWFTYIDLTLVGWYEGDPRSNANTSITL